MPIASPDRETSKEAVARKTVMPWFAATAPSWIASRSSGSSNCPASFLSCSEAFRGFLARNRFYSDSGSTPQRASDDTR